MENAVAKQRRKLDVDEAVEKIQSSFRAFNSRRHFKRSLYKLMIFKNIVDTKVHKIEMGVYRAFEILYFNSKGIQKSDEDLESDQN